MPLRPDYAHIERFVKWRYAPYRPGYVIRAQLYGGKLGNFVEQWRIALGHEDQPHEHIRDKENPHYRKEVGSLEGLVHAMRVLADRAAAPARRANIAVAPSLFEDAVTMKKKDVAFWLGFALDFDMKIKHRVGPIEGALRLQSHGFTPEAIILTGSAWINGHGAEPKFHAIYSFTRPVPAEAIERAERTVRYFTEEMGADPACAECTRVLRLPGSVHPPDYGPKGEVEWPESHCQIRFLSE